MIARIQALLATLAVLQLAVASPGRGAGYRRPGATPDPGGRGPLAARRPLLLALTLAIVSSACGSKAPPPPARKPTLVLWDATAPSGANAELHATLAGQLTSHFGLWEARPVSEYASGDLELYAAAVYLGSDTLAEVPEAFLDDVLAAKTPVMWLLGNLGRLDARAGGLAGRFGFHEGPQESASTLGVDYKGTRLARYRFDESLVRSVTVTDAARAQILAEGVRGDGSRFPWAVRSGNFFYVSELPFTYPDEAGRHLVFADLLFDLLAPETPERHRALVRIEDVHPVMPPEMLMGLADSLHSLGVPFSIAVIPVFEDPHGLYQGDGVPLRVRLRDAPEVVKALRYMVARGGTIIMHGYTHQYGTKLNPYSAVSGDDYEFWLSHEDELGHVFMDGPLPEEHGGVWAAERVRLGIEELLEAGLPVPGIFEYPHYAGSPAHSRAIAEILPIAAHRGLYFPGTLTGEEDLSRPFEQIVPYPVKDVYGFTVLPETLAFYDPWSPVPRLPAEMIETARANRVVRDGFASFFFHPWFEPSVLEEIVTGIQGAGYTFVAPGDVVEEAGWR